MTTNFKYGFSTYPFSVIKKCIAIFEQLLYPLKCLKCNAYIDPGIVKPYTIETCFCEACMQVGFYYIDMPYCLKCGVKFQQNLNHDFNENHLCEACIKTPLKVEKVRAAVEYKGIIKDAIPLFK
ncbi:MAG: hypothetical protein GY857_00120, partial [Desulfobacula sp.]|nr:hypothetical protein [Desulfobacula sp.]